jgi:hypothetical protein
MAVTPAPKPPAPTPSPAPTPVAAADTGYSFEDAAKFTKPVKIAGAGKGVVTETTKKLAAVPVDKTFLVSVSIDDKITDQAERNKLFAAEAKKELSRVNGAARRLRNSTKTSAHAAKNFTIAIVSSTELGYGVRVWRDEDTVAA